MLLLAMMVGMSGIPKDDNMVPLPHGEFVRACIQGGGLSGYVPRGGDIPFLEPGAGRSVEISVYASVGKNSRLFYKNPAAPKETSTTSFGSYSKIFTATWARLIFDDGVEGSWCIRVHPS